MPRLRDVPEGAAFSSRVEGWTLPDALAHLRRWSGRATWQQMKVRAAHARTLMHHAPAGAAYAPRR